MPQNSLFRHVAIDYCCKLQIWRGYWSNSLMMILNRTLSDLDKLIEIENRIAAGYFQR